MRELEGVQVGVERVPDQDSLRSQDIGDEYPLDVT